MKQIEYKLSPCCHPIAGDDVFLIHNRERRNKNTSGKLSQCGAVDVELWIPYRKSALERTGENRIFGRSLFQRTDDGLVNKITTVISQELNINMRSISFESHDGIFEGKVFCMCMIHII